MPITISNICFAANPNPVLLNNPEGLQNVIARLIIEDIQKVVDDYYSEFLFSPPQIEVYESKSATKITDINFDTENNIYVITLEVKPYVGAHNTIGHDRIIFEIDGAGNVKFQKFQHLKSFDFPPWLTDNIRKV